MSTSELQQTQSAATLERIRTVVRDMLGDDSLTLDAETQPSDVEGWDSLANVGIIFGLEEEFQVRLGDEVLAGFATLGALAEMIDAAAHAAN